MYRVDVLTCPDCGGRMRVIAYLADPAVVRGILEQHKPRLMDDSELPVGFSYPQTFRTWVARGIYNLDPWLLFDASVALRLGEHLAKVLPGKVLVPFAKRGDCDEIASFCGDGARIVVLREYYDSDPWRRRTEYQDFHAWLRSALEDMIEFDTVNEEPK